MLLSESERLMQFPVVYNVFYVWYADAPLFFVYKTSSPPPPPVYQDPTCTQNFLYTKTSLISAASWYTGGGDNVL